MAATRRQFMQSALPGAGLLGLVGAAAAAEPEGSNAAGEAAALQGMLERYAGLGDKASGGPGDLASAVWLEETLGRMGYQCQRQSFEVPFFDVSQAVLSCPGAHATVIPQAIVTPTAPEGLSAPLRLSAEHEDLHGAIAVVVLPYKRWVRVGDPQIAGPLAAAMARGAAAVVLVTTGPSAEAIALNVAATAAPHTVSGMPTRPVAVLAPKDAGPFLAAAAVGTSGTLLLTGKGGGRQRRPAFNVIARLERGAQQTLVLSTPRSGWFGCAAERGSGLALWLSLAGWLATLKSRPVNVELLATSGHEYEYMGGERYLQAAAPRPAATALWVHIGASAAARDWHELTPQLLALPSADPQRVLTATADCLASTRAAFQGISGLEATYLADEAMAGGELVNVLHAGYRSAIGLYGIHRYFHTRADNLNCVTGSLVAPLAQAFRAAISAALSV